MAKTSESSNVRRCAWATTELSIAYHDAEWGVPSHDDRHLFEMLTLEGAQAGLSWETILRKRERYRAVFAGFDPAKVARFGPARVAMLMEDAGIIRNRLKIESTVRNARAFLALQQEHGSFAQYLWGFVEGTPLINLPRSLDELPAKTALSDTVSKALRAHGFGFVGSTIVYAYMQAVGVVNDHLAYCFRAPASARNRNAVTRRGRGGAAVPNSRTR